MPLQGHAGGLQSPLYKLNDRILAKFLGSIRGDFFHGDADAVERPQALAIDGIV